MQVLISLDPEKQVPLYIQLADGMRRMIEDGVLPGGTRLPSTRELSESIGISRCTVSQAYEDLAQRGFIYSPSHAGTYVADFLNKNSRINESGATIDADKPPVKIFTSCQPLSLSACAQPSERGFRGIEHLAGAAEKSACAGDRMPSFSAYGRRILADEVSQLVDAELFGELNYSAPPKRQLPLSRWYSLMARCRRAPRPADYVSDILGDRHLREVLSSYLMRTRGIICSADQIALFGTAQTALDTIARIFIDSSDIVCTEDPGFPGARRTFAAYGASIRALAVDEHGLLTDNLDESAQGAKLIYVTPNHQDPTGVPMRRDRREALVAWAKRNNAMIVEDDFDSEFSYGGKASLALKGLDGAEEHVIYLSSFWKVLFPLVKVGFLVLPESIVEVVRQSRALVDRHLHSIEHEALALFIEEGSLDRLVRKTRSLYARRRVVLIDALNQHFGSAVKIMSAKSGTHLMVRFAGSKMGCQSSATLHDAVVLSGLPAVSTEVFYANSSAEQRHENEYLIAFNQHEEDTLCELVAIFAGMVMALGKAQWSRTNHGVEVEGGSNVG